MLHTCSRHTMGRLSIGTGVAAMLLAAPTGRATMFEIRGSAGTLSAPTLSVGPTNTGPISLAIPNTVPLPPAGSRTAAASAYVAPGVVRVNADATGAAGTPSLGSLKSSIRGKWEDSMAFDAGGVLGIVNGVTPGTASLRVELTGSLTVSGDGELGSRYSASLAYGPDGASGWAGVNADLDFFGYSGAELPTNVALTVHFIYGVPFDVQFRLSASAEVGWEGNASGDIYASAAMGESATWGGVQDVRATVPDGGGGTMIIDLPDSSYSLTSPTTDYTKSIPEPATLALVLLGTLAVICGRHRGHTLVR